MSKPEPSFWCNSIFLIEHFLTSWFIGSVHDWLFFDWKKLDWVRGLVLHACRLFKSGGCTMAVTKHDSFIKYNDMMMWRDMIRLYDSWFMIDNIDNWSSLLNHYLWYYHNPTTYIDTDFTLQSTVSIQIYAACRASDMSLAKMAPCFHS